MRHKMATTAYPDGHLFAAVYTQQYVRLSASKQSTLIIYHSQYHRILPQRAHPFPVAVRPPLVGPADTRGDTHTHALQHPAGSTPTSLPRRRRPTDRPTGRLIRRDGRPGQARPGRHNTCPWSTIVRCPTAGGRQLWRLHATIYIYIYIYIYIS